MKVRRGYTEHREHENARKKAWRCRKHDKKLDMELTGAKLRHCGISSAARISAAFYGSAAAAARPRVGAVGFGGAVALFKAPSACGASQPRGSRAAVAQTRAESGSVTRWKKALIGGPHLSATQGAGPACQWKERGERMLARGGKSWVAAPARLGPRRRRKRGGGGRIWSFGPNSMRGRRRK